MDYDVTKHAILRRVSSIRFPVFLEVSFTMKSQPRLKLFLKTSEATGSLETSSLVRTSQGHIIRDADNHTLPFWPQGILLHVDRCHSHCRIDFADSVLHKGHVSKCHFSLLVLSDCCISKLHLWKDRLVLVVGFVRLGRAIWVLQDRWKSRLVLVIWIHGPWSVHPKLQRFHCTWMNRIAGGFLIDFGIWGRHAMLALLRCTFAR